MAQSLSLDSMCLSPQAFSSTVVETSTKPRNHSLLSSYGLLQVILELSANLLVLRVMLMKCPLFDVSSRHAASSLSGSRPDPIGGVHLGVADNCLPWSVWASEPINVAFPFPRHREGGFYYWGHSNEEAGLFRLPPRLIWPSAPFIALHVPLYLWQVRVSTPPCF